MNPLLLLFAIVLVLNLVPAFAPPTWMVFSFLGFRFPGHPGWTVALVGALAATIGRSTLAKASRAIVRRRWMSAASRENLDALRDQLQNRPTLTFGVLLFYAFTPLPSNSVFIAYGLTTLSIVRIAVPFFVGRFVSYAFWFHGSAAVARRLDLEDTEALGYFSVYFVVTQAAMLGLVYVFTKIDWRALLRERKLKWLRKDGAARNSRACE